MPDIVTPSDLLASGARLWVEITDAYELDQQESVVLLAACRAVDTLDALAVHVHRDGPMIDGPAGPRAHPAAVESRAQALTLARLVAALRLPDEENVRPQRRGGARGPRSMSAVPKVIRWPHGA